jgi:hypothetical protein
VDKIAAMVTADVREALPFGVVAGALVVAGGLVSAVNSAAPFEHGSWLAAYLVLVAGVAQLVLGVGRLLLPAPRRLALSQLVLWNAGVALVPVGVFADSLAIVLVGSAGVLAALAVFAHGAGRGRGARVVAYRAVVALLAVSVAIGGVLAGGS